MSKGLQCSGARGPPDDRHCVQEQEDHQTTVELQLQRSAAVFSCSISAAVFQLPCSGELARRGHQCKEVLPPTAASCPIQHRTKQVPKCSKLLLLLSQCETSSSNNGRAWQQETNASLQRTTITSTTTTTFCHPYFFHHYYNLLPLLLLLLSVSVKQSCDFQHPARRRRRRRTT